MKYANPLRSAALAAYPVGAIYMSMVDTNPAFLFGGTWSRIQGRFLLASDDAHETGSTGGEESHTLTEEELPQLSGQFFTGSGDVGGGSGTSGSIRLGGNGVFNTNGFGTVGNVPSMRSNTGNETYVRGVNFAAGGGQPHNNMPPYLSVYVWQRTA